MSAAPVLHILRDGQEVDSIPLVGESVLGRAEDCVIRLEDRAISRQHAVLRPVADGIQVERKSEFAPVSVNGAEVTRAVLKQGDVIEIGPYLLRVAMPEGGADAPRSPGLGAVANPAAMPVGDATIPLQAAPGGGAVLPLTPPPVDPLPIESAPVEDLGAGAPLEVSNGGLPPISEEAAPAAGGEPMLGGLEPLAPDATNPVGGIGEPGLEPMGGLDSPLEAPAEGANGAEAPGNSGALDEPLDSDAANAAAQPQQSMEIAADDAATRAGVTEMVQVRLIFKPDEANVQHYEITKEEISIGRGKSCDIIIKDKKSSRKNAIIRKAGLQFVIKDLNSANGTFVNGARIEELELTGNDRIRIGDTEFEFRAGARDYTEAEKDFLQVPESALSEVGQIQSQGFNDAQPIEIANAMPAFQQMPSPMSEPPPQAMPFPGAPPVPPGAGAEMAGVAGIAGIGGVGSKNKGGFMEKFRALPKGRQYMVIVMVIALMYFGLFDEDEEVKVQKPQAKPSPGVIAATGAGAKSSLTRRFESLTPEQQKFVEDQHSIAFEYYKNKDYDKALFEIRRIFSLVDEYKDSKEIERYALEGKRKREQIEEERRRKDEETRLKQRVLELENETRSLMSRKRYEQAREFFSQILALDPENQAVERWRAEIEEVEESKRLVAQQKQAMQEINAQAWQVFKDGMTLQKKGRYHTAISVFEKVKEVGATDPRIARAAAIQIAKTRGLIKAAREPVLVQAREAEAAGDQAKAYLLFKRATVIDPPHPEGWAGMARVKGILHERAKVAYTEAVLAESYSDFDVAKKKYEEIIATTPNDDLYYERATRKLARYFHRGGEPVQ